MVQVRDAKYQAELTLAQATLHHLQVQDQALDCHCPEPQSLAATGNQTKNATAPVKALSQQTPEEAFAASAKKAEAAKAVTDVKDKEAKLAKEKVADKA